MKRGNEYIKNDLALISIASAVFFIFMAIILTCPSIAYYDWKILHFVQDCMRNVPMVTGKWISNFGMERYGIWPAIVAGCVLASHQKYVPAIFLPLFVRMTWAVAYFFQDITHRIQPNGVDVHSFPSAHTLAAAVAFGLIAACAYRYVGNSAWRNALITSAILWILTVGWCRVWLGMNYPSDVISSWMLGVVFVYVYIVILKLFNR